jgi:hypothetical protein
MEGKLSSSSRKETVAPDQHVQQTLLPAKDAPTSKTDKNLICFIHPLS